MYPPVLVILFLLLLCATQASAIDNYRGGKMEYRAHGHDSLELLLTVYAGCNADIQVPSNGFFADQKVYIDAGPDTSIVFLPLCNYYTTPNICPDTMSQCVGGPLAYTSMVFEYKRIISLKGLACNLVFFWQSEASYGSIPPRNSAISTGPATTRPYLRAYIDHCRIPTNNSPLFTRQFPDAIQHNKDFLFNYGITIDEPLDDSVSFELIAPLSTDGTPVPYNGSYSKDRPLTFFGFPNPNLPAPAGIQINSSCDQISFRPVMANQHAVIALKVTRFVKRQGQVYKISEIMYEHEVVVVLSDIFKYYFPVPGVSVPGQCIRKSLYPPIVCNLNAPRKDPEQLICTNDSILLSTYHDTAYLYQWRKNGTILPNAGNATYWASDSGIYTVDVTNKATGCFKTSTETRVVFYDGDIPVITYDSSHNYCMGDTVKIARENKAYSWMLWKKDSQPYADDTTLVFEVMQNGRYSLDVVNKQGCRVSSNTLKIDFHAPDNSPLFPEKELTLCGDAADTLKPVKPLMVYSWQLPPVSSDSFFVVTTAGKYYLLGKDTNNCPVSDSVNVVKYPLPIVDLGQDTAVCYGMPININIKATATQVPGFKYLWNNNPRDTLHHLQADTTGLYTVLLTDNNGCQGHDSLLIAHRPKISLQLGNDSIICDRSDHTLRLVNDFITYRWSTADTTPSIKVTTNGTYWVNVSDSNSCNASDTVTITFDTGPQITLADTILCETAFITLQVPDWYDKYLWSNGSTDHTVDYRDTGEVWVQASNTCGQARATAWIRGCRYEDPVTHIPNAFSPNADGLNDRFIVYMENIRRFDIKIFNRWGELIYESSGTEGWDGNYAGQPASKGVYGYFISVTGLNGVRANYTGNITLVR